MELIQNLRHLRAFLAAAACGRMTLAAEAVNLSQPATTQAIRKLETALGQSLFERGAGGVTVTGAGAVFRHRVERAFAWLGLAERALGPPTVKLAANVTHVQLRALVAITERGSFSLAARQLGVSQPSVHRAARDFESLCGRRLFHATRQGVEATGTAREVARLAALAFAELSQGVDEMRAIGGIVDGRLVIGCLPLARTRLLPMALTELLRRYPDVRARIVDGPYAEQLHGLRHGRIDVMIGALRQPLPSPDVVQEALFVDPLSIVVRAGHALLTRAALDPQALGSLDWVLPREGTPARDQFEAFLGSVGVPPPRRVVECSSLVALRGLLMESDRAGILSAEQVRYEVEAGFLEILPPPLPGTERAIGLTMRKGWHPTAVQAGFLGLVRDLCGQHQDHAA